MKKLLKYMNGFKTECVLGPLFKLLEASFELLIPLVVAQIVDVGIKNSDLSYVFKMCFVMIFLGFVGLVCSITAQFFAAKAAVGFTAKIRQAVMEHLMSFSYSLIDRIGTSTMVTRLTSDMNQVQNGVNLTLRLLLRSPFVVFGAMIMAFTIDVQSALIFAGVIPVLSAVVFGIMLITMPMYHRIQQRLDRVTQITRENLTGVRVLRAFCKENDEIRSFTDQTDTLKQQQIFVGRISAMLNPLTFSLINFAVIILLHTGAMKVHMGILTQGMVIALYNYMSQILVELIKLANLVINMTKAATCAKRIQSILDIRIDQSDVGTVPYEQSGSVQFLNVTAHYCGSGEPSLEHISFEAKPGQIIGIIGGTGSGKSTLVNLIPRFYDAASGSVIVDGINVKEYDLERLRRSVAVVPQKAELFRGTVRENLLWGNEHANDDQLWKALETAQAKEMMLNYEEGLDKTVSQGGSNFSGGQRQRLTIARALVRKPSILILDDSASALDYATDAGLRKALRMQDNHPTIFIVSQRAASVLHADQILVLDDGKLAGRGTHQELLKNCTVYQEIYYSQFPEEVNSCES